MTIDAACRKDRGAVAPHLGALTPLAAARYGTKTALVAGDRALSYRELDHLVAKAGAVLMQAGVRSGDRVTLCSVNGWQWVVAYFAVLRIGAVVNPVNHMLTPTEVAFITNDCRAGTLIASSDKCAALRDAVGAVKSINLVAVGPNPPSGWIALDALVQSDGPLAPVLEADPAGLATIAYTSGTTGHPKGAMHSHRNVVFNAAMTATLHARTREDVVVSALPLPHVYGNVVMNSTLMVGGTLVIHPRFDAATILDSIESRRATLFEGVPTMYYYLLGDPDLARRDLTSLTRCTVGGQTMPEAKMRDVEERFGCPLLELWGMTELAGLGSTHAYLGPRKLGSIGIPLPYTALKIVAVDDPARELPRTEVGELMVRGPNVMLGYYGNEPATRETIEPDGWLHSGDLAFMDDTGSVFIVDRKKDMILTAGYNVYPAEIERVLAGHPAVAMVAVRGVPDEVKGEVACAYVVVKPGATPTPQELADHCRAELAPYKVPRRIRFVADLPKTSTGKILRRELRNLPD